MGATLGLIARRGDLLQVLAAELSSDVSVYEADVRDAPAIRAAAQDFMHCHGCPDIVIANAGISRGTLTEYAEDTVVFEDILATNVVGMINLFQPFTAALQKAGQGSLVGIASVAGYRGLRQWRLLGFQSRRHQLSGKPACRNAWQRRIRHHHLSRLYRYAHDGE